MTRRVLLDVDGVLANFTAGAAALHGKDAESVTSWNFIESWGLTDSDFWTPMGYDFWANLPVYEDAEKVVDLCERAVGAEHVCLLTSPCNTLGCDDGKRAWVRKHFPQFKRRLQIGAAKEFSASPFSMLVDDHDNNVDAFKRAGGWTCLYPRPWNRNRHLVIPPLALLRSHLEVFADCE